MGATNWSPRDTKPAKGFGRASSERVDEVAKTQPTAWEDVCSLSRVCTDKYQIARVLEAVLAHLNCSLQTRWEPGKGVVYRCEPKTTDA